MKRLILVSLLFVIVISSNGQSTSYFGCSPYLGFIWPHHKEIEYVVKSHVVGLELAYGRQTNGSKIWHYYFNYPKVGVGYFYGNLGNPLVLGDVHAIYPYIITPFSKKNKNQGTSLYLAYGASFLTKHYDVHTNPNNLAIGSVLNVYFKLALEYKFDLNQNFEITQRIGLSHFSNGRLYSPNFGVNLVGYSLGVNFQPQSAQINVASVQLPSFSPHFEHAIAVTGGTKTRTHWDSKRYYTSSIIYDFGRVYHPIHKVGVGVDLFFDSYIKWELDHIAANSDFSQQLRAGIHLSHEFLLNRFSIVTQAGYYLYSPFVDLTKIYNRLGVKYYFDNNLTAGITLKSHNAQADFIEWGIGYYWK